MPRHRHPPGALVVLLADDEAIVRVSLVRRLRAEGHTVTEAQDGAEAVALGTAIPRLDVLVTDQNMPHRLGTDVARALRARHPGLFVALMSGSTSKLELDEQSGLQLAKPFDVKVLVAALAGLRPRAEAEGGSGEDG